MLKNRLNKIVLSILSLGVAMSSNASGNDNSRHEINDIAKSTLQLMSDSNVDGLDQLLDKNFTLTHLTGYVSPRKEWLNDLKTKRFIYHSISSQDISVQSATEKEATVIARATFDATIYGGRGTYRLRLTNHYKKIDNKWILMSMIAKLN